jgi:hypothetical protein
MASAQAGVSEGRLVFKRKAHERQNERLECDWGEK